ncbi:hypothetical protein LEMLEM_LOCUS15754 [Lemmus lemmus]
MSVDCRQPLTGCLWTAVSRELDVCEAGSVNCCWVLLSVDLAALNPHIVNSLFPGLQQQGKQEGSGGQEDSEILFVDAVPPGRSLLSEWSSCSAGEKTAEKTLG